MLKIYSVHSRAPEPWQPGVAPTDSAVWLDLIDPTDEERRQADQILGTTIPTRGQTSAIELSSRLISTETALRVNIPSFVRTEGAHGPTTPLGFVLTPDRLATVRYADSLSFDNVAKAFNGTGGDALKSSTDIFVALIESIVDVAADRIEFIAGELSKLSQAVFSEETDRRQLLRTALFKVGNMQRQITQIRGALLGVSRVVTYLCEVSPSWITSELHARFKSIHADIGSLDEFDQQLAERLQFVLDAVLGFINNDQNDIMRVLTIVSVATVPPMILAGIWGMNFKSIPEYDWPHGYAFGLSMIILSALVPLIAFKWKKWL
jgi:magnesium transporter